MKDDIDTRFEGGPYNGNTFNVPEGQEQYLITHNAASYVVVHVYERQKDKFVYKESITNDRSE